MRCNGYRTSGYWKGHPCGAEAKHKSPDGRWWCRNHLPLTQGPIPPLEPFIVKDYISEDGPTLKGNGFDGIRVGESREEAQDFADFLNEALLGRIFRVGNSMGKSYTGRRKKA